jgi:hypothetical protein
MAARDLLRAARLDTVGTAHPQGELHSTVLAGNPTGTIPDPRTETLTADGWTRRDQPVDRGLAVDDDLQCVGLRGPGERVVGVHHVVQREVVGFEVVDV